MALHLVLSALGTLWLFFLYLGLGSLVFRLLKVPVGPTLLGLLTKFGLGFGLLGNLVMGLCFLQFASSRNLVVLCIILSPFAGIALAAESNTLIRSLSRAATRFRFDNLLPTAMAGFLIAGYVVLSLLPPSGFDSLMYHLSSAKLYLDRGGFWHIFFNPQADFPMLSEMNFMMGLALGQDRICRGIAFLNGMIAVGIVAFLAQALKLSYRGTLYCIAVFLTLTVVIAGLPECDVDVALACWTMMSVIMAIRYRNTGNIAVLGISAFFAGMAVQTKIFGVFIIPLLVALYSLDVFEKRLTLRRALAAIAVSTILAVSMGIPWYLKSFIHRGTILSIGHSVIEGQGLGNPMGIENLSGIGAAVVNVALRVVAAPWTFSLMPSQHQGDMYGALLLAVLPFMLLTGIPRNYRGYLLAMLVYFLEILVLEMSFVQGGSSIRYSLFVLIAGVPISLYVLENLKFCRIRSMLHILLILQIALGSAMFVKRYHREWIAFLKLYPDHRYYELIFPEYPIVSRINSLPDPVLIMTTFNYSNYLIRKPYIASYRKYANATDAEADLVRLGVTHIFANDKFNLESNKHAFDGCRKELADSANGFFLYRLRDASP